MEYVVKTKNLSMKYRDKYAIRDVEISVKPNEIYGLVGKNGAGKTTLMKCLLGLVPGSTGDIKLFESNYLAKNRARMGALIEEPGFFNNLSGYDNLLYYSKAYGIGDKQEIIRLLQLVKLEGAKDKKYKQYSLGMKQRLGIALSLLGDPEILILDEPINGIDPEGIVEIRRLLKMIAKEQNKTIIISSHILSELENIADRIAILNDGKLIDVLDNEKGNNATMITLISTNDDTKAVEILEQMGLEVEKSKELKITGEFKTSDLLRAMYQSNIEILEFERKHESLEDYYLERLEEKNA
ncbi:MAG: ATP-binding cassette domain-containing protein [Ezakiella sp.]|nr:ATP-binding cassette domain-containing protein [Bacillota bacterium]MDY3947008.1 ATP-binding cassette domain-containing protein [Ezakiella sp.]